MTYVELVDTTPFVEVMVGILLLGVLIVVMDFIGLSQFANNLTVLVGSIMMIIVAFFVLKSMNLI